MTKTELTLFGAYHGVKTTLTRLLELHRANPAISTEDLLTKALELHELRRPACADACEAIITDAKNS